MNDRGGDRGAVLVLGASGQVGRFVVPRLSASGWTVHAVGRHGRPSDFPPLDGVSWHTPDEATACLARTPFLVSAGPLALCLDYAERMPALRALAVTSSSSVLAKADSRDPAEQALVGDLRKAEEGVLRFAQSRDLPLLILRPTLIYGCGLDRNVTVLAGLVQRFGILPISTRSGGLRAPVHADDVAQALVAGLESRSQRELVLPLCGGEAIDYRSMLRRIFAALDRKPRFLALPPGVLVAGVRLAAALRLPVPVSPEAVRRQAVNLVFDDRVTREELGIHPRRFHPGSDAFRLPSLQAIERLAAGH